MSILAVPHGIAAQDSKKIEWAIALHGGAGRLTESMAADRRTLYHQNLTSALKAGTQILESGGTSIDAVQATVIQLENCPLFNAGKGAVFTRTGSHELDASIMDGATLQCGGVTMVSHIKNPIQLARLVMEKTPHILLCGEGAEALAKEHQLECVDLSYFYTARRFGKTSGQAQETWLTGSSDS